MGEPQSMAQPPREAQTTADVMMVRPARFGFNPETAASNLYQRQPRIAPEEVESLARSEFDAYARALREAGVAVHVIEDTPEPVTTDAVFPNNWISFHADGTAVFYPMESVSRRAEVRPEILEELGASSGLSWTRTVDLRHLVEEGAFLEGTGSLVLDRPHRIAYACLSPRTTTRGLEAFCEALDYTSVAFRAEDRGVPIYHTNVLMGVGEDFAVICAEALPDPDERRRVLGSLERTGHEVLQIRLEEMRAFAGNLLALRAADGSPVVALSACAFGALDPEFARRLGYGRRIVHASLDTIEAAGGGSARCMLAELHGAPRSATP